MAIKSVSKVFNSGEKITEKEFNKIFGSSGRTSDYLTFLHLAKDLEKGDIIYFNEPVPDSFVSGVRKQVYKLNDDNKEKSEWKYKVRATKEKDGRGNDVTDEQDRQLFTFSIRRMDR
jgi:hypothetical protein